jgi:hypothetical protein
MIACVCPGLADDSMAPYIRRKSCVDVRRDRDGIVLVHTKRIIRNNHLTLFDPCPEEVLSIGIRKECRG